MSLQPVDHVALHAPSPSLLTSARDRSADGFGAGVGSWRTGIAWMSHCGPAHSWWRCPPRTSIRIISGEGGDVEVEGDPPVKEVADAITPVGVDSFDIYVPIACDWTLRGEELGALAQESAETHTPSQMADALWMGTALPDTINVNGDVVAHPTLRRAATDVSINGPGVAGDIDDSFATLLAAYEACTGGLGGAVIHVPSVAMPYVLGGGAGGAVLARPEGNLYRGPLGSVVSPGPGYPFGASAAGANGYGPLTAAGPPEVYAGNAADEVWLYITGPVEYALTPVTLLPEGGMERRAGLGRINTYEVWGERHALVRFDPCCVYAALAAHPLVVS